jgi:hypothetical protein
MKDIKTGIEIYAEINQTVSRGTLRPCDLIPAFLEVIKDTPEYAQLTQTNDFDLKVIFDGGANDSDPRWESERMSEFLNEELFDGLNSYAPEGYHFSSHVGDGSDFGFWEDENLEGWGLD